MTPTPDLGVDLDLDELERLMAGRVRPVKVHPAVVSELIRRLRAAEAGGLDAAWREAEAALPEGWRLMRLDRSGDGWNASAEPRPAYRSVPGHFGAVGSMWLGKGAHGDTPAVALQALTAALRESTDE